MTRRRLDFRVWLEVRRWTSSPGGQLAAAWDGHRSPGAGANETIIAVTRTALGLRSPAWVIYHLQNLERSGALVRDGRNGNTCRLTR
ncbi:hypothetical protein ABZ835_42915 [Streptomyces sp. NPDC047461]|uniref:hypothetical protein n=1 Tax=Streptomyces sp. NPDC047461 TaxID=3155619 RepID=UPI0033D5702A